MSLIFLMWLIGSASKCKNSSRANYLVHQPTVVLNTLLCRYQCIENDLLYPLRTPHNIAPYKSKGLDRASELHISWDSAEQSSQPIKHSQDEHRSQPGMIIMNLAFHIWHSFFLYILQSYEDH